MAHDIFISYSHRDEGAAHALYDALVGRGVRCWLDKRDIRPGEHWDDAIVRGLQGAQAVVLVFSRHADSSVHVRNEIRNAVERHKAILPVRVEDAVPTGSLQFHLGALHWLDLFPGPLEQHLPALMRSLGEVLDRTVMLRPEPARVVRAPPPGAPGTRGPAPAAHAAPGEPLAAAPLAAAPLAATPMAATPMGGPASLLAGGHPDGMAAFASRPPAGPAAVLPLAAGLPAARQAGRPGPALAPATLSRGWSFWLAVALYVLAAAGLTGAWVLNRDRLLGMLSSASATGLAARPLPAGPAPTPGPGTGTPGPASLAAIEPPAAPPGAAADVPRAAPATASPRDAESGTPPADFAVVNAGPSGMYELQISPVWQRDWGRNLLGILEIPPGSRLVWRRPAGGDCAYDLRARFRDGTVIENRRQDLCALSELRIGPAGTMQAGTAR
ncbi:toll/interleukin-1 receptor domain-containing protein [Roseomonas sp. NAR14]|uniref:Toll/interleukin-1 receptor domain-containing protein n=1 Tax=Roseomonas acroporae TaxID=2937791 RepID=A0A9X1Y316_9PROT|nr:toll/interleukin-1 receptor domain-containing protein [Roseomonas acroporae]MCK8783009.1 toll/interleukin-1 receptor domain-containing protein [Roseomonas acroporae]